VELEEEKVHHYMNRCDFWMCKRVLNTYFFQMAHLGPINLVRGGSEEETRVISMLDNFSFLVDNLELWKCSRAEEFDSSSVLAWSYAVGALPSTIQSSPRSSDTFLLWV